LALGNLHFTIYAQFELGNSSDFISIAFSVEALEQLKKDTMRFAFLLGGYHSGSFFGDSAFGPFPSALRRLIYSTIQQAGSGLSAMSNLRLTYNNNNNRPRWRRRCNYLTDAFNHAPSPKPGTTALVKFLCSLRKK
jgi:hypothetical protein